MPPVDGWPSLKLGNKTGDYTPSSEKVVTITGATLNSAYFFEFTTNDDNPATLYTDAACTEIVEDNKVVTSNVYSDVVTLYVKVVNADGKSVVYTINMTNLANG